MNSKSFRNSEEIFEIIKHNTPFANPAFYAMILGFCPYYFTQDKEDDAIHYGDLLYNLKASLIYLKIIELKKNGIVKPEYEVMERLFNNKEYEKLISFFYKDPNLLKEREHMNTWMYYSNDLLGIKDPGFGKDDIKYRLYLNINIGHRASFCKKLIEYFKEKHIPFYFKVFPHKGQTDTVVLYIDSKENLLNTVNAINDILEFNPNLEAEFKDVPPHLCKISDYIGYGFDPSIHNGYEQELSYTEFIQKCEQEIPNDFRNGLRNKILKDIASILNNNTKPFDKFTKREQYEFFISNFGKIYQLNQSEFDKMRNMMLCKFREMKDNKIDIKLNY